MTEKLKPIHPGEILTEDFLKPMRLTPYAVAASIGVPRTRIERLARQQTAMTANTARRLGRFFKVSPAFWMNIQTRYDLERAEDEDDAATSPNDDLPEIADAMLGRAELRRGERAIRRGPPPSQLMAAISEALEGALSLITAMAAGDEKRVTAIIDALTEQGMIEAAEETNEADVIGAVLQNALARIRQDGGRDRHEAP